MLLLSIVSERVMSEKELKLIRKHEKESGEVEKQVESIEKAKIEYSKEMSEVEKNLTEYFTKIDPVIDPDGKCIAWSKRPTLKQLELMSPPDVDESLLALEKNKQYMEWNKKQFEILAELIEIPKHNADWWMEHAGVEFLGLYQRHIAELMRKLATNIENL